MSSYHIGAASFTAEPLAAGLHVVATPIGTLGDITLRALAALAAADTILCEDTRTSRILLDRYAIRTPCEPYHEHNAEKVRPRIMARLREGAKIALISDAGTPLVSDPGYKLVAGAAREGIAIHACPGASAVLHALAVAGLPTDRFLFVGFVPEKAGERARLCAEIKALRATLVFFESPHRIVASLAALADLLPGRSWAVARELTKRHEEVLRGEAAQIAATLAARPSVKGEITLLAGPPAEVRATLEDAEAAMREALRQAPASRAAAEIARRFNLPRKDVYARMLSLKP